MAKRIGPTFSDELKAAGLLGLPFAWGVDGTFSFDPRMTQPQIDAVLSVYAAHDPAKVPLPPNTSAITDAAALAWVKTRIAMGG